VTQYPHSFAFRLDDKAHQLLLDTANAFGLAPATYARVILFQQLGLTIDHLPIKRRVMHAGLLRKYLAELGRHGSNLNQIARRLNSRDRGAIQAIEAMRDRYHRTLGAICDALGVGADP